MWQIQMREYFFNSFFILYGLYHFSHVHFSQRKPWFTWNTISTHYIVYGMALRRDFPALSHASVESLGPEERKVAARPRFRTEQASMTTEITSINSHSIKGGAGVKAGCKNGVQRKQRRQLKRLKFAIGRIEGNLLSPSPIKTFIPVILKMWWARKKTVWHKKLWYIWSCHIDF